MKVLIGYDGSTYADAAIDDLRGAGLSNDVDALVVSVGEDPIVPPLRNDQSVEKLHAGEPAISIANHADTHVFQFLTNAWDQTFAASRQLESYFPNWNVPVATQLAKNADCSVEIVR